MKHSKGQSSARPGSGKHSSFCLKKTACRRSQTCRCWWFTAHYLQVLLVLNRCTFSPARFQKVPQGRTGLTTACYDIEFEVFHDELESANPSGTGERSDRGGKMTAVVLKNKLFISNTWFRKRLGRRWTWIALTARVESV